MKYSIIIPAYKETKSDFKRCLESIAKQTLKPYEVIVVDDCSPIDTPKMALEYNYTYIRHNKNKQNGGARNTGVKKATGDYIVFVNADDYILPNTLEEIDKVNRGQDLIIIGLQAFGSANFKFIPNEDNTPYLSELSMNGEPMHIVNRNFWIKNNLWEIENKVLVDIEWVKRLEDSIKTFTYVPKALYMYQTGHESSQLNQIGLGKLKSDRDEMLKLINTKTKLLIFSYHINNIGGVETCIRNMAKRLSPYYDITIVYTTPHSDKDQIEWLSKYAKVIQDTKQTLNTDICLYASCWGDYPIVNATKKIQMLHADYKFLKDVELFTPKFPKDIDVFTAVSKNTQRTAKELFGIDSLLLYNLLDTNIEKTKPLKLMTLARVTPYKGFERMIVMCNKLRIKKIPFIWYVYSDNVKNDYTTKIMLEFSKFPEVIFLPPKTNLTAHMSDMDYGVLLSDTEGFPYAVYEFLQLEVPCVITDFLSGKELINDGKNGYVFKMNMSNLDVSKLLNKPKFKFKEIGTEKDHLKILTKGDKQKKFIQNKPIDGRYITLTHYYDVLINYVFEKNMDLQEKYIEKGYELTQDRVNVLLEKNLIKKKEE